MIKGAVLVHVDIALNLRRICSYPRRVGDSGFFPTVSRILGVAVHHRMLSACFFQAEKHQEGIGGSKICLSLGDTVNLLAVGRRATADRDVGDMGVPTQGQARLVRIGEGPHHGGSDEFSFR